MKKTSFKMSIGKNIEKLGPETDLDSKTLWHWISREVEWALQTILISKRGKMKKTSFQHNISLRNLVFPKRERRILMQIVFWFLKNLEKLAKVTRNAGYSLAPTNESIFLGNSFFSQTGGKSVTKFPWSRTVGLLCNYTGQEWRLQRNWSQHGCIANV